MVETENPEDQQPVEAEETEPQADGDAAAPQEGGAPDSMTTVTLHSPFFHSVKGCYFKLSQLDEAPVMIMPLEGGDVSLKLTGIAKELELTPEDHDYKTLNNIADALRYVRGIREGDDLPSEMLTGEASWEVTAEDRKTAHNRVTMQLVSWISGEEMLFTDPEQLAQVVEDPNTRDKINTAFSEAAEALGLGRDRREDVVALVENLAEELSFVESLRGQFLKIKAMRADVNELEHLYRAESMMMETILPVKRLFKIAIDQLQNSFDVADAQTGEILAVLKNIANQTKFIRGTRDDLHTRLWAWEPLIVKWHNITIERSSVNERLLEELYRFLARRFLPVQEWELLTRPSAKNEKYSTQRLW